MGDVLCNASERFRTITRPAPDPRVMVGNGCKGLDAGGHPWTEQAHQRILARHSEGVNGGPASLRPSYNSWCNRMDKYDYAGNVRNSPLPGKVFSHKWAGYNSVLFEDGLLNIWCEYQQADGGTKICCPNDERKWRALKSQMHPDERLYGTTAKSTPTWYGVKVDRVITIIYGSSPSRVKGTNIWASEQGISVVDVGSGNGNGNGKGAVSSAAISLHSNGCLDDLDQ
ncbi:hypothetical protein B0H13DRAFT_1900524 [Mycena leptocephala]|nr:hypothetical protein B0H13DRAFT_1900524 [Mycena leptocephala]